ncbi:MAG: tRNA pseudouridine(38-40) synthase TruA [Muribaculaceae bacterium]|nr:tRNA pseudouridine(38-40) synthase TruA [Muribaculaceae bacterium]
MRFFLRLAYNGARFHGWQIQPNDTSVQETIEKALSMIFRRPTPIVGAGRTDTGVNAAMMYAHFDSETDPTADLQRFLRSLNSLLGPDIAVYDIFRVRDDAHARFDATWRTYRYFVHDFKSPFIDNLSWNSRHPLDYDLMNEAAGMLLDVDDFTSFAKLHSDAKTNICKVTRAIWVEMDQPGCRYFEIRADRFLRNMVRAVVGTLVDVGRHKTDIAGFKNIIAGRDRCMAGTSMPPHPLFLWNVTYDMDKIIP